MSRMTFMDCDAKSADFGHEAAENDR